MKSQDFLCGHISDVFVVTKSYGFVKCLKLCKLSILIVKLLIRSDMVLNGPMCYLFVYVQGATCLRFQYILNGYTKRNLQSV